LTAGLREQYLMPVDGSRTTGAALFKKKKLQVQRPIVESSREINVDNCSYLLFFLELKLNESDSLGSMNVHSFSPF